MSALKKLRAFSAATAQHQLVFDLDLAMRHWSGQSPHSAAKVMGVSVSTYRSRRRALELPRLNQVEIVDEYDPAVADHNIQALRYRRTLCYGHKARGIEFYFWCPFNEIRHYSSLALTQDMIHGGSIALPSPKGSGTEET